MAYEASIIRDNIAPNGCRLTTFQVTFPRIILAEMNTHRAFSRNSASSRAIPVEKMIERVTKDPFIPIYWGKNQKGMQADQELSEDQQKDVVCEWLLARNQAVHRAEKMVASGVHKQITNRLLEPFLWHTAIISATDYGNFFAQRCHPDAQPEIRRIAEMMRDLYDRKEPSRVSEGTWHLPYVAIEEWLGGYDIEELKAVSVARCARVSYLNHQSVSPSMEEDVALYKRLVTGGHWSPFEHVARAGGAYETEHVGNFAGWTQFRKEFPDENRKDYSHAE